MTGGGSPVLVIGAGHNGLVCACELAERGVPVLVLEFSDTPGGASRSGELTLPGYVHDRCSGFFPLGRASPALGQALDGIDWITPPTAMAHPFDDGSAIALDVDLESTVASLEAVSPGAGRAWRSFAGPVLPYRDDLVRTLLARQPAPGPALRVAAGLRLRGLPLVLGALRSAQGLGRSLFGGDERASSWLCGAAMHAGIPTTVPGSGALSLALQIVAHAVGWPFPRGGAGRIPDALVERLRAAGGDVRCGAAVERIEVSGGRATGVVLEGGETVEGSAVVATVTAGALARMLPPDALRRRLARRLAGWHYGPGVFKLDFALSGPVPWSAEPARRAGVVHVAGEVSELAAAAREVAAGAVPERPSLVVGQHSLFDPTRAPAGHHTLYCYTHVPGARDLGDEEVADRVQEQIERFAPGFGGLVLARALRSPEGLEAENPSMVGGDLAGGEPTLGQQLVLRPAPSMWRGRTPLRGLYVAGASVHPGPAVHGASGAAAAQSLLEDR